MSSSQIHFFRSFAGFLACIVLCLVAGPAASQQPGNLCIIDNIYTLESNKDPKCHATASRLEDFMYGTPLTDKARSKKIELQKKLVLFVWDKASKLVQASEQDTVNNVIMESVFKDLNEFGRIADGTWYINSSSGKIFVDANDLRQYSTVAYALRAMLSVEQDLLFNPSWNLSPIDDASVNAMKTYLDLVTLAALQLADKEARASENFQIDADVFEKAWQKVLENDSEKIYLSSNYPKAIKKSQSEDNYSTIKSIIAQKIESYKNYNDISLAIFLRNIQVYFARHKWPSDQKESDGLKSYLIESLVLFTKDLLKNSSTIAAADGDAYIRYDHINSVIPQYLPFEVNEFEDVIYFPKSADKIMIESYDLDAFRDSGIHWLILDYAINDMQNSGILEPDPFAAELAVETVAQMALLVLRFTGDISLSRQTANIDIDDMNNAFLKIQEMISKYPQILASYSEDKESLVSSSISSSDLDKTIWIDKTQELGINFTHKSSDWLSRLIRSYVVLKEENLVRMAIPPAFGGSGVAAEDINNDGWDDIILLGGMGMKFLINKNGQGFEDQTSNSGMSLWNEDKNSYSEPRQIIIADLDNDGWQDVFISLVNDKHKIYRNLDGIHFEDLSTNLHLGGLNEVAGPATALDYDNDGDLDLYIAYFGNYLNGQLPSLNRNNQNGSPNKLFKNNGDFNFSEVEHMYQDDVDLGWSQAVGHTDIDQDGWQDIIVGNDFGINAYYINQKNGYFRNESKRLKTDKPSYTMNVGSTDLNGDMYPDLYISNIVVMEKDEKYVNPSGDTKMNFELEKMQNIRTVEANDLFISTTGDDGLKQYTNSKQVGRGYSSTGWSWDADFFDFDNDGDDDLYCLNGMNDFRVYGVENPYYSSPEGESLDVLFAQSNKEKNNFFVNDKGQLNDMSSSLGGDLMTNSRSAAYLDHDNDGDLDILVNNYHDKAVYLENSIQNDNNWLKIKLIGSAEDQVNRDAVGCNIIVKFRSSDRKIWREIKSTTGYLSVHPKMQHFGIGNEKSCDISVKWTNGKTTEFTNVKANKHYIIDYKKGLSEMKI